MLSIFPWDKVRLLFSDKKKLLYEQFSYILKRNYALCLRSSDTVNFFLPLALLLAKTALPPAVAILSLKPCLFLLFVFEG